MSARSGQPRKGRQPVGGEPARRRQDEIDESVNTERTAGRRPTGLITRILAGLFTYVLLTAAWPSAKGTYVHIARFVSGLALDLAGFNAFLFLNPPPDDRDFNETTVRVISRGRPQFIKTIRCSTRYLGYMPLITLAALVVASPVPWRRRLLALALGGVILQMIAGLLVCAAMLHALAIDDALRGFYEVSPTTRWLLDVFHDHVMPVLSACFYIIPVFVWIALTFRRSDWERLLAPSGSAAREAAINANH